ncbi:MAG: hypothetical protein HZB51_05995 [Chloroflexi bacterium]|nr:hypothetical protein [Chloroflexota bacterium]
MRTRLGVAVIVVALVWAVVILAVSNVIGDVPQSSRVLSILGGGAAACIILLGGMIAQERRAK